MNFKAIWRTVQKKQWRVLRERVVLRLQKISSPKRVDPCRGLLNSEAAEQVLIEELKLLYKIPDEHRVEDLVEPLRTYVNYAVTSVKRGAAALDRVRAYRSINDARYLDVGCGYGGFCAAAAAAGAREVAGLDIDERLVKIARKYLAALGVRSRIRVGSVEDEKVVAAAGHFDVITCNDVVEHVDNVSRCVGNLAGALNPGGTMYLAVPNRRSTLLVRSDPHFHAFGIVLLSRPEAISYHTIITGYEGYDVGDYFRFDYYADLLREHGLEVSVTNAPQKSAHWCIKDLEPDFEKLRVEGEEFSDPRLPQELIARIRAEVSALVADFESEVAGYRAMLKARKKDAASAQSVRIARDYYLATWYIIAQRPT